MNKQETYQYLKDHNIPFEITEHPAVYNMEELDSIDLPYPEGDAKNLFVRDEKELLSDYGKRRQARQPQGFPESPRAAATFFCLAGGFEKIHGPDAGSRDAFGAIERGRGADYYVPGCGIQRQHHRHSPQREHGDGVAARG